MDRTPDAFQVLVGSGAALYGGLELGAVGGILGVANLAPGPAAAIHTAHKAGDSAEAGRIQEAVAPVHTEIVAAMGVPGVKVDWICSASGGEIPGFRFGRCPMGSERTWPACSIVRDSKLWRLLPSNRTVGRSR